MYFTAVLELLPSELFAGHLKDSPQQNKKQILYDFFGALNVVVDRVHQDGSFS